MPDFQFSFVVRGIGEQRATVIGQRLEDRLAEDGVDVSAVSSGRITTTFRVLSVDTATREIFDEQVEAVDRQAASDQVESATRMVALIREPGQ